MRRPLLLAAGLGSIVTVTATAAAAPGPDGAAPAPQAATAAPVIGGSNAPAGKWPDAVAVYFPGNPDMQECTGTLIAPRVVITAGHCVDPAQPPLPNKVLIGTNSLAHPELGEFINVSKAVPYPNPASSEDAAILVLASPSRFAPRPIATGWAKLEIKNGVSINLVGYGAIDKNAMTYVDDLKEATTTITDFDCTLHPADCTAAAMPAGELGAGGMGIDTCPGDSGGPLYLPTSFGTFLAGVTSRGYQADVFACSEGGIYERPDKFIGWIEQTAGVAVSHGPEPTFDALTAPAGGAGETTITPNDPKSDGHAYAITTPPAHGKAAASSDGRVRVCMDATATGADAVTVTITDSKDGSRALAWTLPITVAGTASGTCTLDFATGGGGCGCQASGSGGGRGIPGGALPLAGALAIVLRRRRGGRGTR
jgi:endonuclease G